jgi:TPR repeat protein
MKALLLFTFAAAFFARALVAQTAPTPFTQEMVQRAESGDAKAQFELGRAYEDGKGVPQDDDQAAGWFHKAADQGNAQAQNSLGVMYALGRGVQRDKQEAVRWYKKASRQGQAEAIYNVAISYYNGEGVGEDVVASYAWMMAAKRKGDAQAAEALQNIGGQLHNRFDNSKFKLAGLYEKGDEIPQDLPAAVALYLEVAGHSSIDSAYPRPAQYKLCQLYLTGQGMPQDYAQAKAWCKKSGIVQAYIVLGQMAESGLGQEKNLGEAADFYKQATLTGLKDGYMEAGRVKMEIGSHDELKNAYFWYYLAVKRKIPGAEEKLQEASAHLKDKEIKEQIKQADEWTKMKLPERMNQLKKH